LYQSHFTSPEKKATIVLGSRSLGLEFFGISDAHINMQVKWGAN